MQRTAETAPDITILTIGAPPHESGQRDATQRRASRQLRLENQLRSYDGCMTQDDHDAAVPSPCKKICQLHRNDVCIGCARTLAEIAEWSSASGQRQIEILNNVRQRQAADDPPAGTPPQSAWTRREPLT